MTHIPISAGKDAGRPVASMALEVRGLHTQVRSHRRAFDVLRGIDLAVASGETVGVAGESGSGKSMLALSILGLLPPAVRIASGSILFEGHDLVTAPRTHVRSLLGNRMAVIFQDPMTSLNPLFRVGDQIGEVMRRHRGLSRSASWARAVELLDAVKIPHARERARAYPHELSGGQRQRVAIAMAIANEPALLIADEPTTALDVTVQAEILDLLAELKQRMAMAMVFITHDLGVIRDISDRVLVMYAGRIVEHGPTAAVLSDPQHPYTRRLIACVPQPGQARMPVPIEGLPPALDALPGGCAFHPRCDVAEARCRAHDVFLAGPDDHQAACIKPGSRP